MNENVLEVEINDKYKVVSEYDQTYYGVFHIAEDALVDEDWIVRVNSSSYSTTMNHNADEYDEVKDDSNWDTYHGTLTSGHDFTDVDVAVRKGSYGTANDAKAVFDDAIPYYEGYILVVTLLRRHDWKDEDGDTMTTWDTVESMGDVVLNDIYDEDELVKFAREEFVMD